MHLLRQAYVAALLHGGLFDGLADPVGGVGAELETLAVLPFLDGRDEADVAFLDQVQHLDADVAGVVPGQLGH